MRKTNYGIVLIDYDDKSWDFPDTFNGDMKILIDQIGALKAEIAELRLQIRRIEEAREW